MKLIIITGARKGIGRFLAESFLGQGYFVCGCSRKSSNLSHENYQHFCLDICDENAVKSMLSEIKAKFGAPYALINNAGIASMNHLLTTPLSAVNSVFATNFSGSFLMLRECAKIMSAAFRKDKNLSFRIVNFSTVAVALRLEGEAIYAASKAAIATLTQIAAKELAAFNICVNAVAPTPIKTDLIKNVPPQKLDELLAKQAIKRFGEFGDALNAIEFFLNPKSDFITGQILYLGGVNG